MSERAIKELLPLRIEFFVFGVADDSLNKKKSSIKGPSSVHITLTIIVTSVMSSSNVAQNLYCLYELSLTNLKAARVSNSVE